MLNRRCLPVLGCLLIVIVAAQQVRAQFGGLASRIPNGANAIVVLNVEKVLGSKLGEEENWRGQQEKAALAGLTIVPASAEQFLMAAKMDVEFMEPIWQVALARLRYEPNMAKVAARFGGSVEQVAERNAALLPDDSYAVQLSRTAVGVMRPGNRQTVARWLRETSTTQSQSLSPYLEEAIGYAEKAGTPIIMAIDLTDAFSPEQIAARLPGMEAMKGVALNTEQAAKAIASIQGVTLGITITDKIRGAIKVDFAEDISALKDVAKPLLLEVLANQSAMIDEFQDWDVKVADKRIQIGGELFRSGTQRIMSLLDAPESFRQAMPSPGEEPDEATAKVLASQQYFNSVVGYIDDLQNRDKKTMGQVGIWCGRYAKKIDGLPLLNVDDKLLDYGAYVSGTLREAESVLRGVGGKSRVRQMNAPAQYRSVGRWGSDGWYGSAYYGATFESPRLEAQNRARIRTEERVQGAGTARSIVQEINTATAEIRREMTQKFQAEF